MFQHRTALILLQIIPAFLNSILVVFPSNILQISAIFLHLQRPLDIRILVFRRRDHSDQEHLLQLPTTRLPSGDVSPPNFLNPQRRREADSFPEVVFDGIPRRSRFGFLLHVAHFLHELGAESALPGAFVGLDDEDRLLFG